MRLKELLAGVEIEYFRGAEGIEIDMLAYNSKKVKPGGLFVAIQGFQTDGHKYLPQAIAAGAQVVVVEKPVDVPHGVTVIRVNDGRQALARLAANWFNPLQANKVRNLRVFGITGTNGKTTTAWMIRSILNRTGRKTGLIGTTGHFILNQKIQSQHTTPESLDLQELLAKMREKDVQDVVMEVSSHALKLHRVDYIDFVCGVLTTIGRDHLDFHPDFEDYVKSKKLLFEKLTKNGYAVINEDNSNLGFDNSSSVIYFGSGKTNVVHFENLKLTSRGSEFDLILNDVRAPLRLPLPGRFNVNNAMAAASAAYSTGVAIDAIKKGLEQMIQVPGRFERIECNQSFTVIVDFAHTPDALKNVLQTAKEFTNGSLWLIFGAGGDRDRGKRPLMGRVAMNLADQIVLTSDNPRSEKPRAIIADIKAGIDDRANYRIIEDRRQAIEFALKKAGPYDTILIAGKGHENYQEIKGVRYPFSDRDIIRDFGAKKTGPVNEKPLFINHCQ